MLRSLALLFLAFSSSVGAWAQPPQYQMREYSGEGDKLKYVVYVPEGLTAEKPVPLLLFLHGSCEECVTHERILRESNLQFWHRYGRNVQREPTILVAPAGGRGGWTSPAREAAVLGIVDGLIEEFPVDKRRIYLQGFSMGGGGTWHLLQKRPKFFAAANPQALGARQLDAEKIKHVPIWATIGSDDRSLGRMTENVAAIRRANGDDRGGRTDVTGVNPRFSVFPDTNHGGAQGETQKLEGFADWMYAQVNDGNVPPIVRFDRPDPNAALGTDPTVAVAATDPDGTIARVEFHHGGKKVGEDIEAPYEFIFQNLPEGETTLRATAIDDGGKSRTAEVVVRVGTDAASTPTNEERLKRDPNRWEEKIAEFEKWDGRRAPPKDHILFAGSSSIVMWKLNDTYPKWRPINRGFGGSFLTETTHFAERTILKHEPRVVVLYAGENDIARGRSPEDLKQEFDRFVGVVHEKLPRTTIVYLAIKPTKVRWRVIAEIREANRLIEAACKESDLLEFVDTHTPILGDNGRPREELFQDAVHLNEKGYALWDARLRPVLERVYGSKEE